MSQRVSTRVAISSNGSNPFHVDRKKEEEDEQQALLQRLEEYRKQKALKKQQELVSKRRQSSAQMVVPVRKQTRISASYAISDFQPSDGKKKSEISGTMRTGTVTIQQPTAQVHLVGGQSRRVSSRPSAFGAQGFSMGKPQRIPVTSKSASNEPPSSSEPSLAAKVLARRRLSPTNPRGYIVKTTDPVLKTQKARILKSDMPMQGTVEDATEEYGRVPDSAVKIRKYASRLSDVAGTPFKLIPDKNQPDEGMASDGSDDVENNHWGVIPQHDRPEFEQKPSVPIQKTPPREIPYYMQPGPLPVPTPSKKIISRTPSPEKDVIALRRRVLQASAEKLRSPKITLGVRLKMSTLHKKLRAAVEAKEEVEKRSPVKPKSLAFNAVTRDIVASKEQKMEHVQPVEASKHVIAKQPEPESPFVVKSSTTQQGVQDHAHSKSVSTTFVPARGAVASPCVNFTSGTSSYPKLIAPARAMVETPRDPRKMQANHWILKAMKHEGRKDYVKAFEAYAMGIAIGAEPMEKLLVARDDFERRTKDVVRSKTPSPVKRKQERSPGQPRYAPVNFDHHRSPTRRLSHVTRQQQQQHVAPESTSSEEEQDSDEDVISFNPHGPSVAQSLNSPPRRVPRQDVPARRDDVTSHPKASDIFQMEQDDTLLPNDTQDHAQVTPRTERSNRVIKNARDALAVLSNALGLLSLGEDDISAAQTSVWEDVEQDVTHDEEPVEEERHHHDVDMDIDNRQEERRQHVLHQKGKHVHFGGTSPLDANRIYEDRDEMMDPGYVTVLTPVRASRQLRLEYGVKGAITPVRRSTRILRKQTPAKADWILHGTRDGSTRTETRGSDDEEQDDSEDEDVNVEALLEHHGIAFMPAKTIPVEATRIAKSPPRYTTHQDTLPSAEKRRQSRSLFAHRRKR